MADEKQPTPSGDEQNSAGSKSDSDNAKPKADPGSQPPGAESPKPPAQGVTPKPPVPQAKKPAPAPKKPVAKKPAVMEATPWESELTGQLRQQFGNRILGFSTYRGQSFLLATSEAVVPIIEFLKLETEFDYLVDVTAVDYPTREERFELVYILYSFARNERIRIKTRIKDGDKPESVTGVHLTANWLEREVYDMFGIEFANHPDLKRILLPEDWEGFPLRKDSGILERDEKWVQRNIGSSSRQ